jgi:hypothetical protein
MQISPAPDSEILEALSVSHTHTHTPVKKLPFKNV